MQKLKPDEWLQISANVMAAAQIIVMLALFGVHIECRVKINDQKKQIEILNKRVERLCEKMQKK